MWHCQHCGHWHRQERCIAIAHNDTGGAYRCGCTEKPRQGYQEAA